MDYDLYVGDLVRIQLSPSGQSWRYEFVANAGGLYDFGYGGEWVDAIITDRNDEYHLVCARFENLQGDLCEVRFPLPGHPAFMINHYELPGYPGAPQYRGEMPSCDCGCEKAKDGGTHYSWCSKATYMEKHGMM